MAESIGLPAALLKAPSCRNLACLPLPAQYLLPARNRRNLKAGIIEEEEEEKMKKIIIISVMK